MLYMETDGTIKLTRGDTARLTVSISDSVNDQTYQIEPDDILTMTIKKRVSDDEPRVQKTITGVNVFHIEPTDTEELQFGKYVYDVQLTTGFGDVYTIVPPSTFVVLEEVTC